MACTDAKSSVLTNLLNFLNEDTIQNEKISAYIITNHDSHMSEYLAKCDERLSFISGFTGSEGTAIVSTAQCLLWTDPRYFIQANRQLDSNWTLMKKGILGTLTESEWLVANLPQGSFVGGDAKLMSYPNWVNMKKELENNSIKLIHLNKNLVDKVWENRPRRPENPIKAHSIEHTGRYSMNKINNLRIIMKEKRTDVLLIVSLDEIAWLLNLRGSDIPYNPVFFAFLILTLDEVHVFVHEHKLTTEARNQLNSEDLRVNFHSYDEVYEFILREAERSVVNKIWIPSETSFYIYDSIPPNKRFCEPSPIASMKAIKNDVEVKGMINAHIKDGVALCRFFCWLEKEMEDGVEHTEITVADKLASLRMEEEGFVGLSFPTISAVGLNSAVIHYLPTKEANLPLSKESMYLCDSGAQYLDGTTDVTRTVHYGSPTQFQKECFTRVFQGVVSLTTTVFPNKVKGNTLDSFARRALWNVGLDYGHGTGHGIGSYLCVHEGPMGISWRPYPNDPGLEAKMFVSVEPGFYFEGEFGIRIENIVQIVGANPPNNFQKRGFLTFDTITLCPIQKKLLVPSMLSVEEVNFLNDYHKKVSDVIGPILMKRNLRDVYDWLMKETASI